MQWKRKIGNEHTSIREAAWPADTPIVAELFREYQEYTASLGYDLNFQNFETELSGLPGKYACPGGLLLIARHNGKNAGCVAYRALEPGVCEMKRLYVRRESRGHQIGLLLCKELIEKARATGFHAMRLDTGNEMRSARALYASLGFKFIAPYYDNPYDNITYLELLLAAPS